MSKEAKTNLDINKNIKLRWSPRSFSDKVPSKESLNRMLKAASWAASSFNEQPWRFILGIKGEGEAYDRIFESLNEFNQAWAKNAPVVMIIAAKEKFSHNDADNKHHMYDCGAAMANFSLQAVEEDLFVHQMAGFYPDKANDLLNIPEGYRAITAAAIGFVGSPDSLPEDHRKSEVAERERKDLNEIAFQGEWGKAF